MFVLSRTILTPVCRRTWPGMLAAGLIRTTHGDVGMHCTYLRESNGQVGFVREVPPTCLTNHFDSLMDGSHMLLKILFFGCSIHTMLTFEFFMIPLL